MTKGSTTPKVWALRRCRHQLIYIKEAHSSEMGTCRVARKNAFSVFYRKTYDDDDKVSAYVGVRSPPPEGV